MARRPRKRGRLKPWAYYNELDAEKAAWIRELIRARMVAPGEVDERDIRTVQSDDLRGFRQCHFFAGVAVWSYALRLAGWPDEREAWTGSCPCPSFSWAGKGRGFKDPRHLWPDWIRLIRERKPATIFGEQADGAIGYGWLDLVQTDLEKEAYSVGKAVLGACSVGGSDIRQRLYWLADAEHDGRNRAQGTTAITDSDEPRLGLPHGDRPTSSHRFADALNGFWRDADWIICTDGKWRPVESGTFPLADGSPASLGRLRGYGDAINAEVARAFIEAYRGQ